MATIHRWLVRGFVVTLAAATPFVSFAQSSAPKSAGRAVSAAATEVWALEDSYWRYVKAGDVERYLTLWHDNFIGWPCGSDHPGTKATIGDWVKKIREEKVRYRYSLTHEGTVDLANVVVVYYQTPMVSEYPDGRVEGRVNAKDEDRKITHTWLRTPNGWKIIGGMCAPVATSN